MAGRLLNLLTTLSLLLGAVVVLVLAKNPRGVNAVVAHTSFGWTHNGGVVLGGIGLYEVHAFAGPVIVLKLPAWSLVVIAGLCCVAPLFSWVRRNRRLRRAHPDLCPSCGYDLTGNVSGVCPECGTAATGVL
jgi:hypothetical protein